MKVASMKIGILGTGIVGRSHSTRLIELGHDVMMGTRDVTKSLTVTNSDSMGNKPLKEWLKENPMLKLGSFADAAKHGEMVINAINGMHILEALRSAGSQSLDEKVLIDITNPLDFSKGMPPSLFVSNLDSLGEQIQHAFPRTKVVKTLNTVNAILQVRPRNLRNGDHHLFICGNDEAAKRKVLNLLNEYGWKDVLDLGDVTNARAVEMLLPIWVRLFGVMKTPMFNFKIVTEK
jgi:predicted dinucleotide-binding enzyme